MNFGQHWPLNIHDQSPQLRSLHTPRFAVPRVLAAILGFLTWPDGPVDAYILKLGIAPPFPRKTLPRTAPLDSKPIDSQCCAARGSGGI